MCPAPLLTSHLRRQLRDPHSIWGWSWKAGVQLELTWTRLGTFLVLATTSQITRKRRKKCHSSPWERSTMRPRWCKCLDRVPITSLQWFREVRIRKEGPPIALALRREGVTMVHWLQVLELTKYHALLQTCPSILTLVPRPTPTSERSSNQMDNKKTLSTKTRLLSRSITLACVKRISSLILTEN